MWPLNEWYYRYNTKEDKFYAKGSPHCKAGQALIQAALTHMRRELGLLGLPRLVARSDREVVARHQLTLPRLRWTAEWHVRDETHSYYRLHGDYWRDASPSLCARESAPAGVGQGERQATLRVST